MIRGELFGKTEISPQYHKELKDFGKRVRKVNTDTVMMMEDDMGIGDAFTGVVVNSMEGYSNTYNAGDILTRVKS